MDVTESQMQAVREFNQLDADYINRMEVNGLVKNTSIAISQILAKGKGYREDFIQLESGVPGITEAIAEAMGFDLGDFRTQLNDGLTLDENVTSMLESMLKDLSTLA